MTTENTYWTVRHFSQAKPVGPTQGDVPMLLRSAADTIQELGSVDVQDLILHDEATEEGKTVLHYSLLS